MTRLAQGADVLVSEVEDLPLLTQYAAQLAAKYHYTQAQSDAVMQRLQDPLARRRVGPDGHAGGVETVILTHYAPTSDKDTDTSAFVAGVKKTFAGRRLSQAKTCWSFEVARYSH